MEYLLDTHVVLWNYSDTSKLSDKVREIILNPDCQKFVSMASAWEAAIKISNGRLGMISGIAEFYKVADGNGFALLPIEREYLEIVERLPHIHRDPFDRMIIATACVMNMTILTVDENIRKYDVPWCW